MNIVGNYERSYIKNNINNENNGLDWKIIEFKQEHQLAKKDGRIPIIVVQRPRGQVTYNIDIVSNIDEIDIEELVKNTKGSNNFDKLAFVDGDHIDYKALDNVIHAINVNKGQEEVLRANWRKACDKKSAKACNSACRKSLKKTCRMLHCQRRIRKIIIKECRSQCFRYFDVKEKSDSSSSSSESEYSSKKKKGNDDDNKDNKDKDDRDSDEDKETTTLKTKKDTTTEKKKDTSTEKKDEEITTEKKQNEAEGEETTPVERYKLLNYIQSVK